MEIIIDSHAFVKSNIEGSLVQCVLLRFSIGNASQTCNILNYHNQNAHTIHPSHADCLDFTCIPLCALRIFYILMLPHIQVTLLCN